MMKRGQMDILIDYWGWIAFAVVLFIALGILIWRAVLSNG